MSCENVKKVLAINWGVPLYYNTPLAPSASWTSDIYQIGIDRTAGLWTDVKASVGCILDLICYQETAGAAAITLTLQCDSAHAFTNAYPAKVWTVASGTATHASGERFPQLRFVRWKIQNAAAINTVLYFVASWWIS